MATKKKPEPRKVWHRVKVPKAWKPAVGEELEGIYIGSSAKVGMFGPYKTHHVRISPSKVVFVSGSIVDGLFAVVKVDSKIKLVFNGYKPCSNNPDQTFKDFEMFTEEAIKLQLADTLSQAS